MDKLQSILDKFPSYYNISDESTLHKLIGAIVDELNVQLNDIERLQDMIGVDTTHDEDIESRWGNLLSIPKTDKETYAQYKSRLKNSITALSGGTAYAIKYAIAVGLGINNNTALMDEIIKIYDAWKYDSKYSYGNIILLIDLQGRKYDADFEGLIKDLANQSKASGTNIIYIPSNYMIEYYSEFADYTYMQLNNMIYKTLGGGVV